MTAPTCDPHVLIEECRVAYVRYRNTVSGRRWEVHGTCDRRGDCMVGGVVDGKVIETLQEARTAALAYTGLDCPVTPEFRGCCAFTFVELDPTP